MNFILFCNYLVSKVSMVTPRVNICLPFLGKTRILSTRYLSTEPVKDMNLGGKGQTSHFSRSPGSSYNTLMDEEYPASRIWSCSNITLNRTFIHCRNTIYHKFQAVPASKLSIQCPPSTRHILDSEIRTPPSH